jgi:diguanylate cyclase (GGDEF)-like protein/PAS domain S-box-containing protein
VRIRQQLIAAAAVAGLVGVAVVAGLAQATRQAQARLDEQAEAQQVARDVANMLSLTNEFMVYGSERAAAQWRSRHGQLLETVERAGRRHAPALPQVVELQRNVEDLSSLLDRIEQVGREPAAPLAQRRRDLLLERLLIETQEVVESRHRWALAIAQAQQADQRRYAAMVLAAPAVLLALLVTLCLLVGRRVLAPLARLQSAVNAMQRGDLGVRCGVAAQDELGDAARAFDAMAEAMAQDIAALKEAQQRQAQVERQLRAIADNLPVLIAYLDRDERYVFVNATFRDWYGVDPASVVGRTMAQALAAEHHESQRSFLQRALAGERVQADLDLVAPQGTRHLQNVYIPDIQADGSVAGIYTLSTDVTALKQVEQRLSRLARVDALTGLPNRRQLQERLAEAVARASRMRQPLALMFLDVDHFKSINDRAGHSTGDAVLREFGHRLRLAVRITDVVARFAGDEFVVLLEGLHAPQEAGLVAEKIVTSMRRPFVINGAPLQVTTSVGVAYCVRAGPHSPLMGSADEALYEAKAAGRNTYRLRSVEPVTTGLGALPASG